MKSTKPCTPAGPSPPFNMRGGDGGGDQGFVDFVQKSFYLTEPVQHFYMKQAICMCKGILTFLYYATLIIYHPDPSTVLK